MKYLLENIILQYMGCILLKRIKLSIHICKGFDKRTRKIEPIRYSNQFSIGVDVDIFPLDAYDNNKSYLDW